MRVFVTTAQGKCKSNAILTNKVLNYFVANNHQIVSRLSEADIIVITTCGFNKFSEDLSLKCFDNIIKEVNASATIYSIGCLNKINPKVLTDLRVRPQLIYSPEEFDSIFSSKIPYKQIRESHYIESHWDILNKKSIHYSPLRQNFYKAIADSFLWFEKKISYPKASRVHMSQIRDEFLHRNKFYVEIGRGCMWACNYCIIKKARGAPQSRSIDDIVDDIKDNAQNYPVINLVSDDCASYGVDIGKNLPLLLDAITKKFPEKCIELCYVNPGFIEKNPEDFVELFKKNNITSVNIAIQSGSDLVLKNMNRQYFIQTVLEAIARIRQISPTTLIWSHFITGYPEETWGDFFKTLKASNSFDFGYAFAFSPREGTPIYKKVQKMSLNAKIRHKILVFNLYFQLIKKMLF